MRDLKGFFTPYAGMDESSHKVTFVLKINKKEMSCADSADSAAENSCFYL